MPDELAGSDMSSSDRNLDSTGPNPSQQEHGVRVPAVSAPHGCVTTEGGAGADHSQAQDRTHNGGCNNPRCACSVPSLWPICAEFQAVTDKTEFCLRCGWNRAHHDMNERAGR